MIEIVEVKEHAGLTLNDYATDSKFSSLVATLQAEAQQIKERLKGRTVWMINSTSQGGGVAEMLPRLINLLRELGINVKWAVINADDNLFFDVTKRIHNLIHNDTASGTTFSAAEKTVYEQINRKNADAFKKHISPNDILIVHDPQPLPLGQMLSKETGILTIWRCHIGLDRRTPATRAVWRFLRPYFDGYRHVVFSLPEYIPSFLGEHSSIIYPALDPLSHKNRELSVNKIVGLLCNSGLQQKHQPVASPDFAERVMRVTGDGSTSIPGEIGLLFRPCVVQVSRWDRLKGWLPLMEGFIRLKQQLRAGTSTLKDPNAIKRVALSRLILAGPDPAYIADDPEGLQTFQEIVDAYKQLSAEDKEDVVILQLPMASRKENALIVNALQRCATVVAQNSIREGFGLTVTEAMWKHVPVLGTRACGIQLQVRDRVDGCLTKDPENVEEIATNLSELLSEPMKQHLMGRNGQRRAYDEFLIFRQMSRYVNLLATQLPA